jgi:hypothetical protein
MGGTLATLYARAVIEGKHCSGGHAGTVSTTDELKGENSLEVLAYLDATTALDTLYRIEHDGSGRHVHRLFIEPDFKRLFPDAEFGSKVLQLAFAIANTGQAGRRMGAQHQFQDGLSHGKQFRVIGNDTQIFTYRGSTGANDLCTSFLFDDTQTTGPKGFEVLMITKGRNTDPSSLCCIQYAGTLFYFNGDTIYLYMYDTQLIPPLGGS